MINILLFVLPLLFAPFVQAKTFSTSYLTADIPDDWECRTIERNWACQPNDKNKKTAVLVITAKQASPQEHLDSLGLQLKEPRSITGAKRNTITSKLEWAKDIRLNGDPWIEVMHSNREIENFHTYYLGTVSRGLVILLNFSFESGKSRQMQRVIDTLRDTVKLTIEEPVSEAPHALPQAVNVEPAQETPLSLPVLGLIALSVLVLIGAFIFYKY